MHTVRKGYSIPPAQPRITRMCPSTVMLPVIRIFPDHAILAVQQKQKKTKNGIAASCKKGSTTYITYIR